MTERLTFTSFFRSVDIVSNTAIQLFMLLFGNK